LKDKVRILLTISEELNEKIDFCVKEIPFVKRTDLLRKILSRGIEDEIFKIQYINWAIADGYKNWKEREEKRRREK